MIIRAIITIEDGNYIVFECEKLAPLVRNIRLEGIEIPRYYKRLRRIIKGMPVGVPFYYRKGLKFEKRGDDDDNL